jgi:phosphatidylserine decarboxylase
LTKYGKDVILKVLAITLIIDGATYFIEIIWLKIFLLALSISLFGFTLYFFRDPKRDIPINISEDTVISPADGKVVLITDIEYPNNDFYSKGKKLKQISIFLSPLNVHVNRIPISGTIKLNKYIEGDYIVAFDHKSSEKNERTEIGILTGNNKKILFKQIAGFVARRIVCELKEGQNVSAGDKFGMIKFGSRTDILIDPASNIFVRIGDKVTGGETLIAEL